jgi:hypothetical protein
LLKLVVSETNPVGCQRGQPLFAVTLFCACVVSANSAAFLRILSTSGSVSALSQSKADVPADLRCEESAEGAGKKTMADICRMLN